MEIKDKSQPECMCHLHLKEKPGEPCLCKAKNCPCKAMREKEKVGPVVPVNTPVDYLDFVDPDIKEMFTKGNSAYMSYEPLLAQLIKELRILNKK